jgi:zinc protease
MVQPDERRPHASSAPGCAASSRPRLRGRRSDSWGRPFLWRVAAVVVAALASGVSLRAQAQIRPWPSERPPRPLPARDSTFPPYQIQTLPNGLQVMVVLHHEQPVVSMRLLVRTGTASDPKGKLGLVHELASLLDQGTESKSAAEFNDAIDSMGGLAGAGAATDLTFLNMVVMKDTFEAGLRMLSDMARHPAFNPEEIERQSQQTVSGLRVSLEDPDYVADAVFDRLVYGFHPYGLPHSGTPESIGGITRDDLVAFHGKYFVPNNAILAVVGDLTAEDAFDTVKKVFGDWARQAVPAEMFIDPPQPTRRLIVVNKPDAVQTEVRVGHIGIQRKHPDYMAVNLAIRILGGEGSNRLHNVLRTQRGLTYGAQANMDALKESGDFVAQTNTRSDATAEVLRLTFDEFWRLQRDPVSERELADAKAYMTGSFPLTIETPDAIAMQVLNVMFYGLPIEELQNYRERVNAVTVEDIQRVARAYLRPDRLSVVLVGNVAAFGSSLRGVGFNSYETVDLAKLDLTAADFKGAGGGLGAPAALPRLRPEAQRGPVAYQPPTAGAVATGAQDGAKARLLLDRAIAAKGGLGALRAVKRITAKTTTSMDGPQGRVQAEATTYLEYPDHVRVETRLPDLVSVQVYDGQHAWVRDPQGVHEIPAPFLRDLQTSLKRDSITLLLDAEQGNVGARALQETGDEAGTRLQPLELSGAGLEPVVLYIDAATGLIAKQTYVAGGPGQPLIEEVFSDYRPVDGVQIPFTASVRRGGQPILERRLDGITINPPIAPALFTRPAP